jgi:hypothetical protein
METPGEVRILGANACRFASPLWEALGLTLFPQGSLDANEKFRTFSSIQARYFTVLNVRFHAYLKTVLLALTSHNSVLLTGNIFHYSNYIQL